MRSSKLIIGFLCLFIILFSFAEMSAQTKRDKGSQENSSNYCKPLKKKIAGFSLTFFAFGKVHKYDSNLQEHTTNDSYVRSGNETLGFGVAEHKDVKVNCKDNSFSLSYVAAQDDWGNNGLLTVSGTFSSDGNKVEKCEVSFTGYPGKGQHKKTAYNFSFSASNIPCEKVKHDWYKAFVIDNYAEKHNIFNSFSYNLTEYDNEDDYFTYELSDVDQANAGNGFTLTLHFDRK